MIPLSRPLLGPEESSAVAEVLASGWLVQGERVAAFERAVAERTGRAHAVAVANGTAALRIALEALGVGRGDSVLLPDLTWPSPAHAALDLSAEPLLVDVDAREWNLTPAQLAGVDPKRVSAAIAIDQFGFPSRARELAAALPGVPFVVDAACSLGSHTGQEPCGALGVIATLSFHPRKLLTTGEGGMCLTDDAELAGRLRQLRNHGQVSPGRFGCASGNYRLSEIAAAIGRVQLDRLSGMVEARAELAARYRRALPGLQFQEPPPGARPNHQTCGVLLPEGCDRDRVIERLREAGVETGRLSYALHTLPQLAAAAEAARASGRGFANASALAERGLALPLWPGLREADQQKVIAALERVLNS